MMQGKKYTTERGVTIGIVPIPLLLDKIREANPMPDLPTYTEHLAGGATQEVKITPKEAAAWAKNDPDTWAEHAEKWAEYEAETDRRTEVLNDRLWKAVMRKAIQVDVPVGEWAEEQALFGLDVPSDPGELKEHYIWTEVIGGQKDIITIMGLASGAALTEDQIRAAESSFLDTLQRPAA